MAARTPADPRGQGSRGGPLPVHAEVLDPLEPLPDARQLDRRGRQRSGDLDDEDPGAGRRQRPAPDDWTVGQEADGAKESGRSPIGVHLTDGTRDSPGVSCARHGAPSIRPGRMSARDPAQPAARRRSARRWRVVVIGAALSMLVAVLGPAPAALAIDPDHLFGRPVGEGLLPPSPAVLRDTLQRRLDRLRVREGVPGVSVAILFPDGTTWLGHKRAREHQDRRGGRTGHGLRGREHQQDVHGRTDHAAGAGGQGRPRAPGRPVPAGAPHRPAGDRAHAARPHERPAGLLPRAEDRQGAPRPTGAARGTRSARSSTSARPTSSPARGGTTRTRTTSCWGSSPNASARRPCRPSSSRASSDRSISTTRSSRSVDLRAGRSRTAIASTARAPSSDRSTSATARRWRRSPRSSPRPARRARSHRRRRTSSGGRARSTAAPSSTRTHSRRWSATSR